MAYLQFGVPLLLILWLAIWPLPGRARWVHAALVAGLIVVVALFAQWLWPSAFAPYVLLGLVLLAALAGRRRALPRGQVRLWPGVLAGMVALAAWTGVGFGVQARLRPAAVTELAMPLAGSALVTQGGRHRSINAHLAVLDRDTPSLSGWRGQAHGVTLVPVDVWGRAVAGPVDVLAPCAGRIADHGTDERLGAYVVLDCAGIEVVLSGVDAVTVEGTVAAGDPLGRGAGVVIHAQTPGTAQHPFSGDPLWIGLEGVFPVRGMVLRG